jgi:hypothetical protein
MAEEAGHFAFGLSGSIKTRTLQKEAVKKPHVENSPQNFSQLDALQTIFRVSVYILVHPKKHEEPAK